MCYLEGGKEGGNERRVYVVDQKGREGGREGGGEGGSEEDHNIDLPASHAESDRQRPRGTDASLCPCLVARVRPRHGCGRPSFGFWVAFAWVGRSLALLTPPCEVL